MMSRIVVDNNFAAKLVRRAKVNKCGLMRSTGYSLPLQPAYTPLQPAFTVYSQSCTVRTFLNTDVTEVFSATITIL